jgi:hypothetical protein
MNSPIRNLTGRVRRTASLAVRYLRSPVFRARVADADDRRDGAEVPSAIQRSEAAAAPAAARAYRAIDGAALALAARGADAGPAAVVLVMAEYDPAGAFAGGRSAVLAAQTLGAALHLPVRVVALDEHAAPSRPDGSFIARRDLPGTSFGSRSIWMVTHWTTAYAAHVAVVAGRLDPTRVVALVQDDERGFTGYSTARAAAAATYDAGFLPLVNSRPLADHLTRTSTLEIPDDQVFAPLLDDPLLREVASARSPEPTRRILFYARPSKPRNMFGLGVAALEAAVARLQGEYDDLDLVSAGEPHPDRDLGHGIRLRSLGRVDHDAYHRLLGTSDVVLALQASPHPSHVPLEAAVSGALAVTNDFSGTRTGWHPRLVAVGSDVESLAAAIAAAVRDTGGTERGYLPLPPGVLGGTLDAAVEAVVRRLPVSPRTP